MVANVQTMLSVRETPWHRIGKVVDTAPTTAEGIVLAGMDWEALEKPLFTRESILVDGVEQVSQQLVKGYKAIVRSDTGVTLGVVRGRYTPLQNRDAFNWFDPFIESGDASLETAGVLGDGQRVWIMAKINRDPSVIVPGDEILKYLLLSSSHDGSLAIRAGFTPIRVVCQNTLSMAHSDKKSKLLRLKHTAGAKIGLDKLRDTINLIDREFEMTSEQFQFLASKQFNKADLEKYVKLVLFNTEGELSTRAKNTLERVIAKVDQPEQTLAGVAGTWWAAYNAITEHLSHDASRNPENRFTSLNFGVNYNMNAKALKEALTFATGA